MAKEATRNAYGKALAELVVERDDVLVLDADLTKSTKTIDAKKARPEHHFNMGIAEGNMMAVAAGMAASNKVVYASSFAMFAAGRAFEQIRNSICYPNLNVKVCATHAGITVGEDGASHQALEDVSLMRGLPNMTVIVPGDYEQTRQAVRFAASYNGPVYIRLSRMNVPDIFDKNYKFSINKAVVLKEGTDVSLITAGDILAEVMKASEILTNHGINAEIINVPVIKPLDCGTIINSVNKTKLAVTIENHSVIGGLGSAVCECLAADAPNKVIRIGVNDCFGQSGSPDELLKYYGLDAVSIADRIIELKK